MYLSISPLVVKVSYYDSNLLFKFEKFLIEFSISANLTFSLQIQNDDSHIFSLAGRIEAGTGLDTARRPGIVHIRLRSLEALLM